MKGFGIFLAIIGAVAMIAALAMDVSVSSGIGRVNNMGLMADRQNYIIIGGILLLAGLLLLVMGGKAQASPESTFDTRPCPFCAETIKKAAVKCKHCGAELERGAAPESPSLKFGWVARVICSDEEARASVSESIRKAGFPVVEMHKVGGVAAGAFEKKTDAEKAAEHLEQNLGFATTVMFRDKISGDYS